MTSWPWSRPIWLSCNSGRPHRLRWPLRLLRRRPTQESCSPVCKGKERSSARERVMNVLWAPPSSKTGAEPSNYRPISLTSCVARLMEKILNGQVISYLTSESLIYPHQSGFLPGHSTVTQLCFLAHKLQMALEGSTYKRHFLIWAKPMIGSRSLVSYSSCHAWASHGIH